MVNLWVYRVPTSSEEQLGSGTGSQGGGGVTVPGGVKKCEGVTPGDMA